MYVRLAGSQLGTSSTLLLAQVALLFTLEHVGAVTLSEQSCVLHLILITVQSLLLVIGKFDLEESLYILAGALAIDLVFFLYAFTQVRYFARRQRNMLLSKGMKDVVQSKRKLPIYYPINRHQRRAHLKKDD